MGEHLFALRPDLSAELDRAAAATTDVVGAWLEEPPPHLQVLERSVRLPDTADLEACGAALISWDLHRRSGLAVAADGPARPGATVVLGTRIAGIWALAPCRVVDAGPTAFTYATLPGHPEIGVERFTFVRDSTGVRFEVRAVSGPAFWGSRMLPSVARRVQSRQTQRYLDAAVRIAAE